MKISDVIDVVEQAAPPNLAADWDNVGLLVGNAYSDVSRVLLALDATPNVIAEAEHNHCQLIITHHPLFVRPLQTITNDTPTGRAIAALFHGKISLFSAHTNLDASEMGGSALMCKFLELTDVLPFIREGAGFVGRIGLLPTEKTVADIVSVLVAKLRSNANLFRTNCSLEEQVNKIAVCGGGGSKEVFFDEAVSNGCQLYITGDCRYHEMLYAKSIGLKVIDATHYATENICITKLYEHLKDAMPAVEFIRSEINGQIFTS